MGSSKRRRGNYKKADTDASSEASKSSPTSSLTASTSGDNGSGSTQSTPSPDAKKGRVAHSRHSKKSLQRDLASMLESSAGEQKATNKFVQGYMEEKTRMIKLQNDFAEMMLASWKEGNHRQPPPMPFMPPMMPPMMALAMMGMQHPPFTPPFSGFPLHAHSYGSDGFGTGAGGYYPSYPPQGPDGPGGDGPTDGPQQTQV